MAKERNVLRHELNIGMTRNKRLKIFFISDIHKRIIDEKLLRKIDSDIDLVIIGGDLAEKNVPLSRISNNIKMLSKIGQVFYVWGNNDREVGENQIRHMIRQYHGVILDNRSVSIAGRPNWGICGTDDPSSCQDNVEKALENINRFQHVIFVSHQPVVWQEVEQYAKPTLMLAGHTHGGQIRIGKLGISPKGFYRVSGERAKLISNGFGTTSIPLRLGAKPQCHIITINYADSQ